MRLRWDRDAQKFIPIEEWNHGETKRSDIGFPMIISDHMDTLRHPATGLYSDSKSTFRKMTAAAGCMEMGDQAPLENKPRGRDPKQVRAERVGDIKASLREHGVDVL